MNKFLEWETPEYFVYKKGVDWYWYLAICAIFLLIFAAYQRSFLFGAIVIIAWFTIMLYSFKIPKTIKIYFLETGIQIERNIYPWANIKSFWIFEQRKELSLELKKTFFSHIKILTGNVDVTIIREILSKFIPENEQENSFIDNLSDLIKF